MSSFLSQFKQKTSAMPRQGDYQLVKRGGGIPIDKSRNGYQRTRNPQRRKNFNIKRNLVKNSERKRKVSNL